MKDADTSDDAFFEFAKKRHCETTLDIWQECRRRCEKLAEERERKAFELVWSLWTDAGLLMTREEAYRAFKEAQK